MEILNSYDITSVIDVRSFPASKFEHFTRARLETSLKKELFDYHYAGKELGGFRKGGYENYTRTAEFANGISALEAIASSKMSVIICAERFPWKCHRRYIARELQNRGWAVGHILDKGKVWAPKRPGDSVEG